MAKRRKRRKVKAHRRRKTYARKRVYRRHRKAYATKRRKSSHRRRRRYASNPKRYHVKRRRRSHRRRRNPSGVGSLARRSYGTAKSLFSMGMAKNVVAGIAGFAGVKYIEQFIPYVPSSFVGNMLKKSLAAVGAYTLAGFVPGVSRSMKKYVLYGSALNIALDLIQVLPQVAPNIAEAARLNGYSGGSLDVPSVPARLTPTALVPAVLQ